MKEVYVAQLSQEEQNKIVIKIEKRLTDEGYTPTEIKEAIKDALDSKIVDILHVLITKS
jgi:SOS-response transcriptional repressor LexA